MSRVKPSASFIAEHSRSVLVDKEQCKAVAHEIYAKMQKLAYSPATWSSHLLNPKNAELHMEQTVDWIFAVDCLNFSFWNENDSNKYSVRYRDQSWTGYWSMVAAINRALDENVAITSPEYWNSDQFTPQVLASVFRSENGDSPPLLNERFQVLKEAGKALTDEGFTRFYQVVEKVRGTQYSALNIVDWVTTHIRSFDDAPIYRDRRVCIFKRAQILVADIWACFQGHGIGRFDDIDEITMFADYRVPQILAVLKCLQYAPSLNTKIRDHELLMPGCQEEVEIRGCSIEAVEQIVEEIKRMDKSTKVNAVIADFYLWDTAKEQEQENTEIVECHRTRSVYY